MFAKFVLQIYILRAIAYPSKFFWLAMMTGNFDGYDQHIRLDIADMKYNFP